MRWLVGDVQGCARELDRLVRDIQFDPGRDELWCVGDVVNRGPDSLAALRLWRDLGGRGVLGNHDVNALLARSGRRPRAMPTLAGLFADPECDALLATLRRLPVLVRLASDGEGPDAWVVHAGLHPAWTDLAAVARTFDGTVHDDAWLERDDVSFATRVRCCTPDGVMTRHTGLPGDCPRGTVPCDRLYRGTTLVVHGHWAMRGHYRGPRTLGLDSGCVYGGPLTAWCQEEDRIVQVPSFGI